MEMMDMGHKMKDYAEVAPPSQKSKDRMMYPELRLSHKVPSQIMKKDVGDTCHFEIMGKIIEKSESEGGEHITIEIYKMGYVKSHELEKKISQRVY